MRFRPIAALWTGIERTHGTFGFAWLALGNAGIDMPLPLRVAPFVGVYGISFLFAMMSAVVAFLILRRGPETYVLAGHRPGTAAAPGFAAARNSRRNRAGGAAQHAGRRRMDPCVVRRGARALDQGIAWSRPCRAPSNSSSGPRVPGRFTTIAIPRFTRRRCNWRKPSTRIFFLGPWLKRRTARRSIRPYCCGPDGQLVDRYDKINLVPFGEFVPKVFGFVNRITQEAGDFAPGNRIVAFSRWASIGWAYSSATSRCFPDEVRQFVKGGANLLVNISNDGYFGHSAAREQHLEIARMRAVENRRWLIRSTNDGITAVIDPAGHIDERLPPYRELVEHMHFAFRSGTTFYTNYGDWFAWGCLIAAAIALAWSQRPHYAPEVPSSRAGSQARRRP